MNAMNSILALPPPWPLCLQEKEHLRLAVARVSTLRPDVLLVERSVARFAQVRDY